MYEKKPSSPVVEQICPICGKNFCPAPYHKYKVAVAKNGMRNKVLVCTYTCFAKAEREYEEQLKQHHRVHKSWSKQ